MSLSMHNFSMCCIWDKCVKDNFFQWHSTLQSADFQAWRDKEAMQSWLEFSEKMTIYFFVEVVCTLWMIVTRRVCMSCFLKLLWCWTYCRLSVFLFCLFEKACKTQRHVRSTVPGLFPAKSQLSRVCIDVCCSDTLKNIYTKKWLWACWYTKPFDLS